MKPITGIDCCARVANGHAAMPPSRVMNSRRLIAAPKTTGDIVSAKTRALEGVMRCPLWVISGLDRPILMLFPNSGHQSAGL